MAASLNSRHTETFTGKGISTWVQWACSEAGDATILARIFGMKLTFIVALLLATSPVAAQTTTGASATSTGSSAGSTSSGTGAGTTCEELMTATFCNESSSPNTSGYGSNGGAAATSTGITTPSPAVPACAEGMVAANELCN
jgi:hypothetical protein